MKIELHILQNFPPHCLNRDDTNTPKDCLFGGFRRARISSQCSKRSMRTYVGEMNFLEKDDLGIRSKQLVGAVATLLVNEERDETQAQAVVETALKGIGLAVDEGKTQYLLYLAQEGIKRFAQACDSHWKELLDMSDVPEAEGTAKKTGKQKKKDAKEAMPKELKNELLALLDGKKAVDLALFGRMLADLADKNVEASCQVAHAISTNDVKMEMDFYTAVDDLNTKEDTGAGMMGVVEFNSACFYRYLVVDTKKLIENLDGDTELAYRGLRAFLRAAILAIPTGKQNSMAALTPPSYVQAIVRDGGEPWNLANAFTFPVRPGKTEEDSLVCRSIKRLEEQLDSLKKMYGENGQKEAFILGPKSNKNLENLLEGVLEAVRS